MPLGAYRLNVWRKPPSATAPLAIGDPYGGGYYAGNRTYNGVSYKIILAPKAFEMPFAHWPARNDVYNYLQITNANDGKVNVWSIKDQAANPPTIPGQPTPRPRTSPIVSALESLTIGGYRDWYWAAKDELTFVLNSFGWWVPTAPASFQRGGSEAFDSSSLSGTSSSTCFGTTVFNPRTYQVTWVYSAWAYDLSTANFLYRPPVGGSGFYTAYYKVRPIRRML
jgi:hypothetical protein